MSTSPKLFCKSISWNDTPVPRRHMRRCNQRVNRLAAAAARDARRRSRRIERRWRLHDQIKCATCVIITFWNCTITCHFTRLIRASTPIVSHPSIDSLQHCGISNVRSSCKVHNGPRKNRKRAHTRFGGGLAGLNTRRPVRLSSMSALWPQHAQHGIVTRRWRHGKV